ncbi:hypothetical protein PssvBMR6_gp12 [Pseudomonas phage MR6]|uniref:Uncharacterized protein n=1 Tax=Pseudomonas phage MR5 TaxID=2711172 RepID=A0A6M3TCN3_9CAUD|nr:hypothetical protein PssvBMR5_gp12 [Pseudomonas phage MR5]QJD54840.1 hypothetical protein PssvBMR6_gp12 [Pseudomonas phage MR6]
MNSYTMTALWIIGCGVAMWALDYYVTSWAYIPN